MDFRRIQWIFLLIFIAIDVFLSVQWYQGFQPETSGAAGSLTVLKEIRNDGISTGTLSKQAGEGFYVAGQLNNELRQKASQIKVGTPTFNATKHSLTVKLASKNQFTVNLKHPARKLDPFSAQATNVINGTSYVYNARLTALATKEIVYVQTLPTGLVIATNGQLRFKINSAGKVVSYTQTYIANPQTLRERTTTISEQKAVIWLYQYNQLANGAKIIWHRLAYAKLLKIDNTVVYVPTWFFGVQNGNSSDIEIKKVNAFTGEIMQTKTTSTKNVASSQI
ncbi:two-component system regulatory protein YycI [Periweissella beninensis]|uniref:Two-component system regulatory protein YycI n=1 Tax=Periweissella beninensis TaxID=504936 RepID=A0ABT0VHN4_9LACO|nr:two-component system regulatory protein YycI [Periweissella beninensis]MBM7543351.1 regulatory protein YycI of two-component signal transduction system YycFG [Periweissella beninensis]MCM2437352.1 two-component system regulatory protein YycI [Periweissella beninensis]MCT4396024.1 hypothetical protein [Periweissella beninensis]